MRAGTSAGLAVGLLLWSCGAAEASIFRSLAAVSLVRERAGEFGYDTSGYTDEEIAEFVRSIPRKELREFVESYARRPDEGTEMTARLEEINRVEFEREKALLGRWVEDWERVRSERPPRRMAEWEAGEESFALNF